KRRSFQWTEPVHREEFRIRAPRALEGRTVRGRLTVFLGSIILAEVALTVRVGELRAAAADRTSAVDFARPYRKIFASYSHTDRAIVDELTRYATALGDEYLRDWVHLRTGEVWTERLEAMIREADVFQLFWSASAMRSRFVRQEWEYALSLGRANFVRPTYWE